MLPFQAIAFALLAAAPAAPAQHSNLTISLCDVGAHQQFEVVSCNIELKNTGDKPIRITKTEAAGPDDKIEPGVTIPEHGVAYLKATIAVSDSIGFTKRAFRLTTDEPGKLAQRTSIVQAFASTVLDQATPTISIGDVRLDSLPPAKAIDLSSREVRDFRVLAVVSKPDYLDVSISEDGHTVRAAVNGTAPWGVLRDKIKLKINAPQQPEATVVVEANVQGDIVAGANPFSLGLMRTNNKNEFLIRVSSRSGKDFEVGDVSLKRMKGKTDVLPCKPAKTGCKLVRLQVANDQGSGRISGVVDVTLPALKRSLPIQVSGILLDPETKIHDLNKEAEEASKASGAAQSTLTTPAASPRIDVKQAIKQAVDKSNEVPPPGTGPLLRWSVANQIGYYGYIIYRADTETGPALRVNKDIIRLINEEGTSSGSYQWRDNSAESGKTYWYSIGLIKEDGEKVPLSSAQKVVAK